MPPKLSWAGENWVQFHVGLSFFEGTFVGAGFTRKLKEQPSFCPSPTAMLVEKLHGSNFFV